MTIAAVFTLGVVVVVVLLLASDLVPPEIAMFGGLAALMVSGVVEPHHALSGFSNPATATIAVLLLVAEAARETGALRVISRMVFGNTRSGRGALLRLVVPAAALSAFVNNTPIVAMLLPVVRDFAHRLGERPSRFLMALSFATLLGGTCTLIGTSANLVVSGLMEADAQQPMGMLELAWVGVPTALLGLLYLVTLGDRLTPRREDPLEAIQEASREFLAEVVVLPDSPLAGRTVEQAGLRRLPRLYLAEIRRGGVTTSPVAPDERIEASDHLVFVGQGSSVGDLRTFPGLQPLDEASLGEALRRNLFEVVISDQSRLVGRSVRDAEFRRRYDAAVLAVHRAGTRIPSKIGDIVLRAGDTLMLTATAGFGKTWRASADFYLVSEVDGGPVPRYRHAPLALAILGAVVVLPVVAGAPMLLCALGALLALLLTGCLSIRGVRRALDVPLLLVVASSLGLAQGLEASGAADMLAGWLRAAIDLAGPPGALALTYLATMILTSIVTNVAAAALVFPVAMAAAEAAGLPLRPFAIAVAMAASAAFATPIAYQTNMLVLGPGGYRFGDFLRVGLPLNALCMAVGLVVIPWHWGLAG